MDGAGGLKRRKGGVTYPRCVISQGYSELDWTQYITVSYPRREIGTYRGEFG